MENNIKILLTKFEKIKNMGWIKSPFQGTGSIGSTFEFLLGKNIDNFSIPDFNEIEIKTKNSNCKQEYISLFTAIPYGENFFEIQRINNLYGYPDRNIKESKILQCNVFCNYKTKVGQKYYFSLKSDYKKRKLKLLVYNKNYTLIDNKSYWELDEIEEKLIRKLSYLAFVKAEKYLKFNQAYYKYQNINIYKLKNSKLFFKLLDEGKIKIQFRIGVFKKGPRTGTLHDHGTVFAIKEKYLLELYNKIY